jgi:DNA-binding CsgD family transcriptional regulator
MVSGVHDAHDERVTISNAGRGRTERPRPREGWASLTDSERRVVDLVVHGMTNRQAAAAAYLSRHTIDFHLRQAFRKLNVSSRVELTRVAIEQEAHRQNSGVAR